MRIFIISGADDAYAYLKVGELHEIIMQRPFPNGPIIAQLVSEKLPNVAQHRIFALVQRIKLTISQQEMTYNLAKQASIPYGN